MGGRLAAYLLTGFLLGAAGSYAAGYMAPPLRSLLTRSAAALGGAVLIGEGLARGRSGHRACALLRRAVKPGRAAFAAGIATGLAPCAPFFVAASRAAGTGGAAGAAYFGAFFAGTSLWFLPLFGAHAAAGRLPELRRVARLGMIALGAYFLAFVAVMGVR
jgi:sulfite exporter TauE/SafE